MKKILSLLGIITLIGTSTTSLVACNTIQKYTKEELKELKEKNKIDTKDGILEWIAPQEKPFNTVDNKWYYVVWKINNKNKLEIIKFKNDKKIDKLNKINNLDNDWNLFLNAGIYQNDIKISNDINLIIIESKAEKGVSHIWQNKNDNYFKSVYRWNLDTVEPNLVIDSYGNIKVDGV